MSNNPWRAAALHTNRSERALVEIEYAGTEESTPCGICQTLAFYRSSVGAFQCPNCNALEITHRLPGGGFRMEWVKR